MQNRYGTIRNELSSINLLQNEFKIDERQFWDILGYLASFLEKINYYNSYNEPDGHWKELIENDPVIFIVSIINEPLHKLKDLNGKSDFKLASKESKIEMVHMLLGYFKKITRWYNVLNEMGEYRLANKIGNILNDLLSYEKKQLEAFLQENEITKSTPGLLTSPPQPDYDSGASKTPGHISDLDLTKAVNLFFKGVYHIQDISKKYLVQNIQKRRGHAAHTSMYIVFTLLYEKLSHKINIHSKNHLDFYYKQVLQQKPSDGRESSAIVYFKLLPGISNFLLKSGTLLSAGKINSSKEELLFKTQKPLLIQDMQLIDLQTLFFNKNPYIKSGTKNSLISSVNHIQLICNGKKVLTNKPDNYLFGANEQTSLKTQIDAQIVGAMGFAISSSVLELSEGERTIDLSIKLKRTDAQNILLKLLNEIKEYRKLGLEVVFTDIFDKAFKISYSSEKGWNPLEKYHIEFDEPNCSLCINLLIPASLPPVTIPKKNHENLTWPALRFELNEFAAVYPYSFLKDVEIASIKIDVDVKNIKNLSVYNNIGKMPLGKTFDLFGPLPSLGSWIMIGKSELYKKYVTDLAINFLWDSLPVDFGGFETYYENYNEEITNDSFKVSFTMLSNGHWLPDKDSDREQRLLFETRQCLNEAGEESVRLKNNTTLGFSGIDDLGLNLSSDIKDPLIYTFNSNDGFVRLTLTSPSFAFGQELYQQEFTAIATYNATNKTNIPYPNKPFVPKVNKISLNYKATDTLFFNDSHHGIGDNGDHNNAFFHISPFGWNKAALNETQSRLCLVPSYDSEGYLLLNLKGVSNAGLITMYFDLQTTGFTNQVSENALKFEYFEFGAWKTLPDKNIMNDDTNGLIKSGIIEILLPDHISNQAETVYQLRIIATDNAAAYPLLKGIYLNAVEVKSNTNSSELKGLKIPAGSIKKLVGKFPAIQKVDQPVPSFDGHLPEKEARFYTRVSERLRHKGRAVSNWDYERLILERFQEVKAVKCTNLDQHFTPMPGGIKIIVLRADWTPEHNSFFNQRTLSQMENYLKPLTSTFVNLEVINPKVEYLIVRGIIEFMPGEDGGYYDRKINTDINAFLSPVYSLKDSYEGIGGVVVPNTVVGFIEDLPYVKSVKKLAIEHIIQNGANSFSLGMFNNGQEIKPSTPWSVLVPFNSHQLENNNRLNDHIDITNPGIGALEIGTDFILGEPYHELATVAINSSDKKSSSDKPKANDAILVCKIKNIENE
jgi:hypothetical protein